MPDGSGPPDKWTKTELPPTVASTELLDQLNQAQPTSAFVHNCEDGVFLFAGFYGDSQE